MRRSLVPLVAALLLVPAMQASAAPGVPAGYEVQTVADDLDLPVGVAWAPDGRMFIAEKDGVVKVHAGGAISTVVDLRDQVNSFHDRGLLGIAADKEFAANGWLYLLYTVEGDPLMPDDDDPTVSRLSRITVAPDNTTDGVLTPILGTYTPPVSDFRCPRPPSNDVDCIPADARYHAIGTVRVDPADGTLWVGSGDASSIGSADSHRAYDERSYAGKLLHVGTDGRGLPGHPFCPGEANTARVCTKLYAKGFRNPFRFTLRGGGKGPVVGDVGQNRQEEIDLTAPGRDYGWPCEEGTQRPAPHRDSAACQAIYADGPRTPPDLVYDNPSGAEASITGGPIAGGRVYFADYANRWIRSAPVDGNDAVGAASDFVTQAGAPVDLQTGPDGNLTYVDLGDFTPGAGAVRRVVPEAANRAPWAEVSAAPRSGAAPLAIAFSSAGSGDPDGDALTYAWDFGDGETSTQPNPTHTYEGIGTYTAVLTVSDGTRTARRPIRVSATSAPRATITQAPGTFRAGERVDLAATGAGDDDLAPADADFSWRVVLVHGTHRHAFGTLTGRTVEFTPASDHDADSYYLVTLRATDASGAWDEDEVRIYPATVRVGLSSRPPGAPFSYGDRDGTMPASFATAIGYRPWLSAPPTFLRGGSLYTFESWSNRRPRSHSLTVPAADLSLRATYNGRPRATPRAEAGGGRSVLLHAGAADPDGDPLSVSWDLGDGSRAAGPSVRHEYRRPGVYRAAAVVDDRRPGGRIALTVPPVTVSASGVRVSGEPPRARVGFTAPRRGLRVTRGGKVALVLRNAGDERARGALTIERRGRDGALARRRFTLPAKARRKLVTRLTRSGRVLTAGRRLPIVVTIEAAADGGPPRTVRVRTTLVR